VTVKSSAKKLWKIFGILFGLLILAIVLAPTIINVDRYRPQITHAANERIHGKLELGKLSLSLLGKIRIQVDGLKLKDAQGREVLSADDAYFHLPFLSLLSGSPRMIFKMNEPRLHVVKDSSGQLNVMNLAKEVPETREVKQEAEGKPAGQRPSEEVSQNSEKEELPGMVKRARLGLELANSVVTYRDEATGSSTEVKDLNVFAKDLSLSHPTQFSIWADLNTRVGPTAVIKGPFRVEGEANPQTVDGKLKVDYRAKLTVDRLRVQSPLLKTEPEINVLVQVLTDRLENILVTMKAPGNDLRVEGKLVSFTKPKLDLHVTSPGLDLDQLLVSQAPEQSSQAKAQSKPQEKPSTKSQSGVAAKSDHSGDLNAIFAPVRENPILGNAVGNMDVNIQALKVQNATLNQIVCQLDFKEKVADLNSCQFQLFSGTVKPSGRLHMAPKTPRYEFSADLKNLDLSQAVQSRMPLMKNTILGKANMTMSGQGASLNPDEAKANLKARGNMKVEQAVFATIDVAKMVQEGLNKALQKIAEKVPAARGKTLPNNPLAGGSKYELISSDFTISDGKFQAPNFSAKAVPKQGVDLTGSASLGLQDYSLKSRWEIIDTYNLTGARDLSVDVAGTKIEHILAQGDGPVRFPVGVGCTILKPCYSYEETPEALLKVASNNLTGAMRGKAGDELKKKADQYLKGAPPSVQESLKGLFK
jgi:hypothetical protein